jgi:hypothetical protein
MAYCRFLPKPRLLSDSAAEPERGTQMNAALRAVGRRSASAVLGVLLVMTVAAVGAHAQEPPSTGPVGPNVNSFGFTVRPYADPGALPRDAIELLLPAGQIAYDKISVANLTDQPKRFFLYAADSYNTSAGGLALHLRTDPAQDAGSWIKLPVDSYTIPPKSAALVPIVVTLPADATPGDHGAGIVAEEQVSPTTESQTGGLQPIHRVGTRVFVRVEGPVTPAATVTQMSVAHSDPLIPFIGSGSAKVTYTIANTGNVRLHLTQITVKISGPLGWTVKSFTTKDEPLGTLPQELLPGATVTFTQSMGAVPPFILLSASVSVQAQDPTGQTPLKASGNIWFWVVPWLLVALIVVAILGRVGWRWWKRRPPADTGADGPDDGVAAPPPPDTVAMSVGTESSSP